MTRSTAELRVLYSPPCKNVRRVGWRLAYAALDAAFRRHNYAPKRGQTGAQNCRRITGGSGYSLHAYFDDESFTFWSGVTVGIALACDVNWNANPYGSVLHTDMPRAMVDEIVALRTNSGAQVWRWGGYYGGNKDAMHYEIVASPEELATGIRGFEGGDEDMAQVPQDEWEQLKKDVATLLERTSIQVVKDGEKKDMGIDHVSKSHAKQQGWLKDDGTWAGA